MENLKNFDEWLNEGIINEGISEGDTVTHRIYPGIKGTVIAGPMKWDDLKRAIKGIDMPEEDDETYVTPYMNKPVWIAIELSDGQTQFGANMMEFK